VFGAGNVANVGFPKPSPSSIGLPYVGIVGEP
jgi:hypothetical protein